MVLVPVGCLSFLIVLVDLGVRRRVFSIGIVLCVRVGCLGGMGGGGIHVVVRIGYIVGE